ncbi:MAG: hypothetical protein QXO03_02330 [Thermoplasmatales archaeon]
MWEAYLRGVSKIISDPLRITGIDYEKAYLMAIFGSKALNSVAITLLDKCKLKADTRGFHPNGRNCDI